MNRRVMASIACMSFGLVITGCGSSLEADSTCSEYLQTSSDEQDAAIARVAEDLDADGVVGPLGSANVDYLCGNDPDMTLGEAVQSTAGEGSTVAPSQGEDPVEEDEETDLSEGAETLDPIDQDPVDAGVGPPSLATAARIFNEAQKQFYEAHGRYTENPKVNLTSYDVGWEIIDVDSPYKPDLSESYCVEWTAINDSGMHESVVSTWLFDSDTGWYEEPGSGLLQLKLEYCA